MSPSVRQTIAIVVFIFIAAVVSQSQVAPAKSSTATISGKVTLKNKGLGGILVFARYVNSSPMGGSRLRAITDQTGKYRMTNVPKGTYHVMPLAPGLVVNEEYEKSVVVEEGDNIEDVNFSMLRGGVITGKISDADDKPVIEEQVFFQTIDGPQDGSAYYHGGIVTDDRGVYRVFGLRPGKYKVYVGQSDNRLPGGAKFYEQTFYPSVTDPAKATVVEVTEGSESTDIDITMGRQITAFKVTGKIVDGETGRPVPNVRYGIFQGTNEGGQSASGFSANANGEFNFEGVMPGKYSVFIEPDQNTEVRAEALPFEVIDHDVTGLVIKTVKGSGVSGVVVMEGTEDPAAISKIRYLEVRAVSEHSQQFYAGSSGAVGPDGSFRVTGLSPGVIHLALGKHNLTERNKPVVLVRIERDGTVQPSGLSIKDGEQVTGLRLIVKTLTAAIRGQVKVEDGELPPTARMSLWVRPLGDDGSSNRLIYHNSSPQIDSRGRFLVEGLLEGTYEINVAVFADGRYDTSRIFKQQVTVTDNSVSEVTVTIKLKP
jgi:protocatechuate 3,4-dioxygenase beta subunit